MNGSRTESLRYACMTVGTSNNGYAFMVIVRRCKHLCYQECFILLKDVIGIKGLYPKLGQLHMAQSFHEIFALILKLSHT